MAEIWRFTEIAVSAQTLGFAENPKVSATKINTERDWQAWYAEIRNLKHLFPSLPEQ